MIRALKNAVRAIVGDQIYVEMHERRVARLIRDTMDDIHNRDVVVALSLGLQYAYNSYIEGDIAELGTDTGFTARAIAAAMVQREQTHPQRQLHLFDSFKGLPPATSPVDLGSHEIRTERWVPGLCRTLSKEQLIKMCSRMIPSNRITIHDGWFADTVPQLPPDQRFAFIHFDGDLYQSTIDAFRPLLARGHVSKGAVICFDDWNSSQAEPDRGERKAWAELCEDYKITYSDWGCYSSMGQRFIVHDYERK
jgi:O-methyltransferase